MKIKVPIPPGGENNLESKFLRAQSGDPEAVKEYREALEPQAKWIPVSERMPEKNDEYLVVDGNDEYATPADWIGGAFYTVRGYGFDSEIRELHNVTHWMPLPQPPKKGQIKAHCMGTEFPKREEK